MSNIDYIIILRVRVVEQVLNIEVLHNIIDRTQNVYKIIFEFDNEWTGYAKTVLFRNNKDVRFSILDNTNECLIPSDMVVNDNLYIAIQGNRDGQILTTKKADYVKVMESGGHIELMTDVFTQSEYDKLMDELANVRIIAEQAILDAQQVSVDTQQVATDKGEISYWKDEVERNTNTVTTKTTEALNAASRATSQAAISQNLFDQLQPMNADVSSKAPSIVSEAAGSVITLDDGSNMPLQSLTIYGKSTQDGTPTPEAPVEIVSVESPEVVVRSTNLFDTAILEKFTINNDSVNIVGSDDGTLIVTAKKDKLDASIYKSDSRKTDFISKMLRPGKIYINAIRTCPHIQISGWKGSPPQKVFNLNNISLDASEADISFDFIEDETSYILFEEYGAEGQPIISGTIKPMLYQEGDGTWTPYKSSQSLTFPYALRGIPVASGGNYTDESGQQWICDTLEVNADGTGKLVQRVKEVNMKDLNIVMSTTAMQTGTRFYAHLSNLLQTSKPDDCLSNRFMRTRNVNAQEVETVRINPSFDSVYLVTEVASTLEEMISYVNANETLMVYPLEVPSETNLTAEEVQAFQALRTNKPYSTIFNSTGADQKIEYVADTKKYIDKKFQELTGGETNV